MAPSRRPLRRTFTWRTRGPQKDPEEETLLQDADEVDSMGLYPPDSCWTSDNPHPPNPHADLPVYTTIHRIRLDIIQSIDDPYSLEQLRSARINIQIIRPLVDQFYKLQDVSIIYCLLVNRMQFLREQSYQAQHQTVRLTRALVCELIAEKIIRRFGEHNPGPKGLLLLANILVAPFEPFQNAPEEVIQENAHAFHWAKQKTGPFERKLTALEIAIVSESKGFLASTAVQKVIDAIYTGRLSYTPSSFLDIIPDHYKHRPISLYDPRRGPWLNQYRLTVPRTRNILEIFQFSVLLILYILTMMKRRRPTNVDFGPVEVLFMIYASGWCLDNFATILEHGWQVYTQNLWSFLDATFCLIYVIYFYLRLHAAAIGSVHMSELSVDVLSIAAPVLIPRLAFNVMSENMLFVSLRAMMSDFLMLTALGVWTFAGFLLSMKWLNEDKPRSVIDIGKWMIYVWFGLDGEGIQQSVGFHWLLGPVLMIAFAFLGNTLFLTIVISMLSNTFSNIVQNVTAEVAFRRTVLTFEGVKSDAIFAYFPPFNVLALVFLLPMKFVLTPRWFHKINVAIVRTINAPTLLAISWYERRTLWSSSTKVRRPPSRLKQRLAFWDFARFGVHSDIAAVFDTPPPRSTLDEIALADDLSHAGFDDLQPSGAYRRNFRHRSSGWQNHQNTIRFDSQRRISFGNEHEEDGPDSQRPAPEEQDEGSCSPKDASSKPLNQTDGVPIETSNFNSNSSPKPHRASDSPSRDRHHHHHHHPQHHTHHQTDPLLNLNLNRKDSMFGLVGGVSGTSAFSDAGALEVTEMLHETSDRLEVLEEGMQRIERLLTTCLHNEGVVRRPSPSAAATEEDDEDIDTAAESDGKRDRNDDDYDNVVDDDDDDDGGQGEEFAPRSGIVQE
ncbi:putative nonselective cation channel [Phaeomoniella chlamydospora]|uniref:Putative nonselective cation channel n=1 Tax=Phaeomoniella chlamydospora TaxID=158046 RepID=A0A0G2F1X8_PHACM|nr:putative nonselective cation channel [Phaeomoniella chlamydospora]